MSSHFISRFHNVHQTIPGWATIRFRKGERVPFGAGGLWEKLCVKCWRFELWGGTKLQGIRFSTVITVSTLGSVVTENSVCFNLLKATTPAATLVMNAMTDYVRPRLLAVKEVGTSSEDGQNSLPFHFPRLSKGPCCGTAEKGLCFPEQLKE